MFSSIYHEVRIDSYKWLKGYVVSHELWNRNSAYGIVVYKESFMVVKKSKLKIVCAENEVLMADAQKIIKDVEDMFDIFIDINNLASIYPPIEDVIKEHLYHKVMVEGCRIK